MGKQRTGGMTTIGVLNIIFGTLGCLVFLLMILGAGFMTAAGAAAGGEEGSFIAVTGGIFMLLAIAGFAGNLMLFISGIGILKMASWGRTLGLASGTLGVLVYGGILFGGFSIPMAVSLVYCGVLAGLCFSSGWKSAFGAGGTAMEATTAPPATVDSADSGEDREAA